MDFLKKHYEKIILSLVLLILAGTAAWLPIAINKKREEMLVQIPPLDKGGKKIQPVDLASFESALDQLKNPPRVDFSLPHHLFNPVTWKQRPDGNIVKIVTEDLPRIIKVTPLHLIISFERAAGAGYYFKIVKEASPRANEQRGVQRYLSEGGKSDVFNLKKVEGAPENPESFIIELNDTKEDAVVTPAKPYMRLEGHSADLKYDVDNRDFKNLREGSSLVFGGEQYKVIAITENEVTVQANSNQKQVTIRWKPAP